MKKFSGKNKLAVIALAVMIGVAGYMSFADSGQEDKKAESLTEDAEVEVLSYEEIEKRAESENADGEIGENLELNDSEDSIGEAVLTSAQASASSLATAKLTREQNRAKSREALMDVISDEALSDEAKKEAADTYVKLSDTIEKETDVETILAARGYTDAIVTISESSVDVALMTESLEDSDRAQIEDIITRKTGYDISDVAISLLVDK